MIKKATGLLIWQALKRRLLALQLRIRQNAARRPYDIYLELDLGPGGYAVASSAGTRQGITEALQKKLRR